MMSWVPGRNPVFASGFNKSPSLAPELVDAASCFLAGRPLLRGAGFSSSPDAYPSELSSASEGDGVGSFSSAKADPSDPSELNAELSASSDACSKYLLLVGTFVRFGRVASSGEAGRLEESREAEARERLEDLRAMKVLPLKG